MPLLGVLSEQSAHVRGETVEGRAEIDGFGDKEHSHTHGHQHAASSIARRTSASPHASSKEAISTMWPEGQ